MIQSFLTKAGIIGLLSLAVGGGAYTYFTYTQKKLSELTEQVTTYEINIRQLETALANIQRDKERIERETAALQVRVREAETYQNDLMRKLQRHDLTRLTLEKPGLIETRVNDATKKIFDDLESISRDN